MPDAPGFIQQRAEAALSVSRPDRAVELRRAAIAARWDDTVSRRYLVEDALQRGDAAAIAEQFDPIHLLGSDEAGTLAWMAGVHDALGREDEAIALYNEALAV